MTTPQVQNKQNFHSVRSDVFEASLFERKGQASSPGNGHLVLHINKASVPFGRGHSAYSAETARGDQIALAVSPLTSPDAALDGNNGRPKDEQANHHSASELQRAANRVFKVPGILEIIADYADDNDIENLCRIDRHVASRLNQVFGGEREMQITFSPDQLKSPDLRSLKASAAIASAQLACILKTQPRLSRVAVAQGNVDVLRSQRTKAIEERSGAWVELGSREERMRRVKSVAAPIIALGTLTNLASLVVLTSDGRSNRVSPALVGTSVANSLLQLVMGCATCCEWGLSSPEVPLPHNVLDRTYIAFKQLASLLGLGCAIAWLATTLADDKEENLNVAIAMTVGAVLLAGARTVTRHENMRVQQSFSVIKGKDQQIERLTSEMGVAAQGAGERYVNEGLTFSIVNRGTYFDLLPFEAPVVPAGLPVD